MLHSFTPNYIKLTTITLKKIPNDLHEHIIHVQALLKIEKKVSQYSLEKTIIKIVSEHKELTEKKQINAS